MRVKPKQNTHKVVELKDKGGSNTKDDLCQQSSQTPPQGNIVTVSTGPFDRSPSPSCNANGSVMKPGNGRATSLMEGATVRRASTEKESGALENVLYSQDSASTSASSDG